MLYNTCDFNEIKDDLIDCNAKKRLPKNSKSVICFSFPYKVPIDKHNISRYAVITDYHLIVKKLLNDITNDLKNKFKNFKFEAFVDNSPIPEVKAAALCGLGIIGDNGLLITEKYGSWVFLGEIVTDMKVKSKKRSIKSCMHCGKCLKICPSGGIDNKNKCASAISQKKGDLNKEESKILKKTKLIWGCDLCQECCPLNKSVFNTPIKEFYKDIVPIIKKGDYNKLEDRAFQWRSKKVIERNLIDFM